MTANAVRLAVGTFTVIPVPPPTRLDRPTARLAMIIAPVATLPIGAAVAVAGVVGGLLALPSLVTAALAIGVSAVGSRGLHLDGLADTADGLSASYDRARSLEVMRRGNTGPIGAATLVLVLILQVAATASLLDRPWGALALGGLICLSRTSLLITCAAGVPAARTDGLGAAVAGVVPRPLTGAGVLLAAAAASGLLALTGSPWWLGAVAVLLASLTVLALVARCLRRFGGVTGDVLGAGIEVSLALLLVVATAR
jgi:adenosylcobinamide-GDP ribazoletransferase